MSKPNLLLITCDWSVNKLAKLENPKANIHRVGVKCTGRVDPIHVLDSFKEYDGVLLIGCPIGDCHFIEGNIQSEFKVKMIQKLMKFTGVESGRLAIKWASPLKEGSAAKALEEYIEDLTGYGKLELCCPERLEAAKYTFENFRMRAFVGKELMLTERGNVYGKKLTQEEFDAVADEALELEFYRNWIHMILKSESLSVKQLAKRVGLDTKDVLDHIVTLNSRGMIQQDGVDGMSPLYVAMEGQ